MGHLHVFLPRVVLPDNDKNSEGPKEGQNLNSSENLMPETARAAPELQRSALDRANSGNSDSLEGRPLSRVLDPESRIFNLPNHPEIQQDQNVADPSKNTTPTLPPNFPQESIVGRAGVTREASLKPNYYLTALKHSKALRIIDFVDLLRGLSESQDDILAENKDFGHTACVQKG